MTDLDGVMRALSDGSRRRILIALLDEDRTRPFPDDEDDGDRAIRLHHVHLPLLEQNDLVAWDREAGTVRRGDDFEAVEPVLTALESGREALPEEYLPEGGRRC